MKHNLALDNLHSGRLFQTKIKKTNYFMIMLHNLNFQKTKTHTILKTYGCGT